MLRGRRKTTDEGLTPAPHRRDRGLAPLSCRLPLKGGVMDGHGSRFARTVLRNATQVKRLRQDRLPLNPDPDRDRKYGLKPPFHHSIPPNF